MLLACVRNYFFILASCLYCCHYKVASCSVIPKQWCQFDSFLFICVNFWFAQACVNPMKQTIVFCLTYNWAVIDNWVMENLSLNVFSFFYYLGQLKRGIDQEKKPFLVQVVTRTLQYTPTNLALLKLGTSFVFVAGGQQLSTQKKKQNRPKAFSFTLERLRGEWNDLSSDCFVVFILIPYEVWC